ncbi:hypothetical protein [Micromonospora sp. NPDC050695]|uniref:hypothetical protein n=1 Tax=Micromonospora sp. NPDC050695 TaxID=3154938 RepID=UPI0033F87827
MSLGDLVEHWTLVGAEQDLVAAKHRDTQLGFALLLKFYGRFDRFPRGIVWECPVLSWFVRCRRRREGGLAAYFAARRACREICVTEYVEFPLRPVESG